MNSKKRPKPRPSGKGPIRVDSHGTIPSLANSDPVMMLFDAHLDLAMNALEWNRDLTWSIEQIRQREASQTDKPDRGRGTLSFPAMRRGEVGLCVATQI